jgi:NAD(P)H-dependent flavin oxidoreductase YrpB (nitropropane dioxygenase family)
MTLSTAFTEFLSVKHPVALAPMGEVAGGALAAAVSNGGGLGLVGGGRGDRNWTTSRDQRTPRPSVVDFGRCTGRSNLRDAR